MKKGPLSEKTFLLAIEIVELYKYLVEHRKEFVMSKQVLRSGTNPGAMIREAQNAESKKDFIHKLKIAQKEVGETQYWLDLLISTGYIDNTLHSKSYNLSTEVMKMIRSSVMTMSKN